MIDGKVMAAVFATLAAIAAALNGGSMDANRLKSSSISAPGDSSFNQVVPDSVSSLTDFLDKPEPENSVKVSLESKDMDKAIFRVKGAKLDPGNLTFFKMGSRTVESGVDPSFYGFKGRIDPGGRTSIKGRASGFLAGPVNVSGGFSLNEKVQSPLIEVREIERSSIEVEDVSGTVLTNSSSTRIRDSSTDLSINSFSGSLIVYTRNSSFFLDGKVDRLEAGSVVIGQ